MKTYTANDAARAMGIDNSRVLQLCRGKRLGYTLPKFGKAWVITDEEIRKYLATGPKQAGRPKKNPG